jgi:hypothetical protein
MRRYGNGASLDLVMVMMNKVYLSFKLQGCKTTCRNVLWKIDGHPSTTLVIKSLLHRMLLDSMVLVLLKCLWEIDQLIKYFVLGKSLMPYRQFKHQ